MRHLLLLSIVFSSIMHADLKMDMIAHIHTVRDLSQFYFWGEPY